MKPMDKIPIHDIGEFFLNAYANDLSERCERRVTPEQIKDKYIELEMKAVQKTLTSWGLQSPDKKAERKRIFGF